MTKFCIFFCFICIANISKSQVTFNAINKPIIDNNAIDAWTELGYTILSHDGKYTLYTINNQPKGSTTLFAQSTDKLWRKEFINVAGGDFSDDNNWAIFRQGDSLCLLLLGTITIIFIPHVEHYELFTKQGKTWLAYGNVANELFIRELSSSKELKFNGVQKFWLNSNKKYLGWQSELKNSLNTEHFLYCMNVDLDSPRLVYQDNAKEPMNVINTSSDQILFTTIKSNGSNSVCSLHYYDIGANSDILVWAGHNEPRNYSFDSRAQQLVFFSNDTIWYYKKGMHSTLSWVTNQSIGIDTNFILCDRIVFSKDGNRIFFKLIEKEKDSQNVSNGVKLDVWNYKDKELKSVQLMSEGILRLTFTATLRVGSHHVLRIENTGEEAIELLNAKSYIILKSAGSQSPEWHWQKGTDSAFYLLCLEDGKRQLLTITNVYRNPIIKISPNDDYIVYYNPANDSYYSYQISDGITRNLTINLGLSWQDVPSYHYYNTPNPFLGVNPKPRGIIGWVDGGKSFLVYDSYDIWKLDPAGRRKPLSITNGYGRKNHIKFEIDLDQIYSSDSLLLHAFNQDNKHSGFYGINIKKSIDFKALIMRPLSFGNIYKATTANLWTFTQNSSSEGSNLYMTKDFKQFSRLSSIQQEKYYNWYTSELINWTLPNGDRCQGILFKPENFDSLRKYPILFNCYQIFSDEVYNYNKPELSTSSNINIPYFVSRGYLVFKPDIHYRIGYPGESALQSILSAAEFLSTRRYIDKNRMGLAGHSWGGYETNYVVSHSHLFSAAAEGAGMSDFIADYNGIDGVGGVGFSRQPVYEVDQARMGSTLWQRPDLYMDNSPVLKADKITTPILMLHNRLDKAVPWSQGVELFTALRRLGKRVWMLQYDGEGHSVNDPKNSADYTMRLTQFFDHFLMGAPPPEWMTKGIPASRKGLDSGLELDMSGLQP